MEHSACHGVYSPEAVHLCTQGYIGRAISFMYPYLFVAGPNRMYRMCQRDAKFDNRGMGAFVMKESTLSRRVEVINNLVHAQAKAGGE